MMDYLLTLTSFSLAATAGIVGWTARLAIRNSRVLARVEQQIDNMEERRYQNG